jgi:hypothetical protein
MPGRSKEPKPCHQSLEALSAGGPQVALSYKYLYSFTYHLNSLILTHDLMAISGYKHYNEDIAAEKFRHLAFFIANPYN